MFKVLAYPFYLLFILREKFFNLKIFYKYLPPEIDPTQFIMNMDLLWILRGMFGRSIFMIPNGEPNSRRFDSASPYFQTWIGTYYVNFFINSKFKNSFEKITKLAECSINDQSIWLKVYGAHNIKTTIDHSSIKLLKLKHFGNLKQEIYYGEINTYVDDYIENKPPFKIVERFSVALAELYNKKSIDFNKLLPDKIPTKEDSKVKLFGFISVIEVSKAKYILTYACADIKNKAKVYGELYKTVCNIDLVKN